MKTCVVVQNVPSPYRVYLLTQLDALLQQRGWTLHVYFMARNHAGRPASWDPSTLPFQHTFLRDWGWKSHHFNPGVLFIPFRIKRGIDCLIVGSAWDTFTGMMASWLLPRKIGVIWAEGNTQNPGKLDGLLGLFKRWILRQYTYVAVPGAEGVAYMGLHAQRTKRVLPRCVVLPNLVDEARFKPREAWNAEEIATLRHQFALQPNERFALCPARLIPEKGLLEFIEKLEPEMLHGWKFVIMGEGELGDQIRARIIQRKLQEFVIIHGYLAYHEMPRVYAAADLFVLPSVRDMNPLSVVEAMHSGVPLLLSNRVGNYAEALGTCTQTGWGFSPFDHTETRNAVKAAFCASDEERSRCGKAAKQQACSFWNTSHALSRFLDTIGVTQEGRSTQR